ncbi:glutamine amidotransferase [Sporichthya brevicatena]|uniref:Glutamine amidotransferase n=1 Tax=Sporichthya brevicatena TaxID=171442 RepID=A0ABN1G3C6_9ACTN
MTTNKSGLRALVVGESWIKHTIHMKGFDHFQNTEYEEGAGVFLHCLERSGIDVTYIRGHEVSGRFPTAAAELAQFDVVVISDIGANSFLLCDETFLHSQLTVNRLELLADYVEQGGGLVMVGGYLSFSGIEGRARYGRSPLARVLPVEMFDRDDRVELPEGFQAQVDLPEHPALGGTPPQWPTLLGYNQFVAKPEATVVASRGDDPILVTGSYGAGNTVAFASDLAPHWAPPQFMNWEHYPRLWEAILTWAAAGRSGRGSTTS